MINILISNVIQDLLATKQKNTFIRKSALILQDDLQKCGLKGRPLNLWAPYQSQRRGHAMQGQK